MKSKKSIILNSILFLAAEMVFANIICCTGGPVNAVSPVAIKCNGSYGQNLFTVELNDTLYRIKQFASEVPSQTIGLSTLSLPSKEVRRFFKGFNEAFNEPGAVRVLDQAAYVLIRSDGTEKVFSICPQQPSNIRAFFTMVANVTASQSRTPVWSISLDAKIVMTALQKPTLSVQLHRSNHDLDELDTVTSVEIDFADVYDSTFNAYHWVRTVQIDEMLRADLLNNPVSLPVDDENARWVMARAKIASTKQTVPQIDVWYVQTSPVKIR